MAYDQDSEYEDGDYPWKAHVGSRFNSPGRVLGYRYGAQPDLFGQEFGDRSSKLFVYTPQQIDLTLAGFLGIASLPVAVALVGGVDHNENSLGSTTIAATKVGITPGNLVVVFITHDTAGGTNAPSVSDGTTTNPTPDVALNASALLSQNAAAYLFHNHSGGTKTFTATFSTSRNWRGIWILELSGAHATAALEGTATAQNAAGTTASTGNVSPAPTLDGTYLLGYLLSSPAITGPTAPFSDLQNNVVITSDVSGYAQATAAAIQAQWTLAASGGWACFIMSIKPASGSSLGQPLSGALTKTLIPGLVSKVLDGSITPAGALQKQVNRILAGAFTPGGTLQKLLSRALAGGFTPTGALTRVINRILVGGFTPAGALAKKVNRSLAGGSTPSGALTKQTQRTLAGAVPSSGALVKQTGRTLGGGFTPSGALAAARQYFKTLTGGFTPSGILSKSAIFLRTLTGGFTPAGALTKQTNRTLTGGVAPAGTLAKLTSRTLAGALVLSGALQKQVNRVLAGGFTPSGILTKTTVYLRTLSGGFTPTGTVTKQTNRIVSGGIAPSGAVGKRTFRNLAGSIAPTGALSRFLTKLLSGGFTPAGTLTGLKAFFKTFSGAVAPSGTIQRQTTRTTQGAIVPSGAVTRRTFRTLVGQIGLSGQLSKRVNKNLSGFLTLSGNLTWQAIGHDFLILLAGVEGARYILGALSVVRYRLENKSQSRYGPTHTGEASDELDNTSSSKDDL